MAKNDKGYEVELLDLTSLETENGPAWVLVNVHPERFYEYKDAMMSTGIQDPAKYGDVLAYKLGASEPTPQEKIQLRDGYGYKEGLNIEENVYKMLSKMNLNP